MYQSMLFFICLIVLGCGDPSANAPMLTLKIERDDGTSHTIGRHRVFVTGVLSESGDADGDGSGESQRVTVNEISEDGVTLVIELSATSGEKFTREVFVRKDQETEIELPNQSKMVATLESRP